MYKVAGTYEILGTFASQITEAQLESYLSQVDAEVSFIQNSDKEVHLALPYYTGVEDAAAHAVSDAQAADVSGGEIIGVAVFLSLGVAGVGASLIGFGVEKAKENGK